MAELSQNFFDQLVKYLPTEDVQKIAMMNPILLEKINRTPLVQERKKRYIARQDFNKHIKKQLLTVYCGAKRVGEESSFDKLGGVFEVLFHDYLVPELRSDLAFEQWYCTN